MVYSVVHGVVAIDLLAEGGQLNVNEELIKRGFAVPCEESYESKMNHDLREMAYDLNLAQKRAHNREQMELAYYQLNEIEPPRAKDCNSDVCLKGPHSPLETSVHTMMLLVAGDVGCNEGNTRLTLRHTTLMPNIPGLPAILALLFCPVLLKKRRKHRQPECVPQAWEWRSVPEDDILEISVPDMGERSVIYPLHAPTELYPVARDVLLELKKENDQLKLLVSR
ncbi:hypothetical protein B5X24_HaOG206820 [Helicoverpa armigera]|uniref:Uncharacterized protein n=1 Tax=Helicoverpa armigera TaxID=29058 RepID=A0A2W1BMZ1_HELAM|nr:hypothetical protein B5X24_HaOG206820 [Helicoverpa armigera]